MHHKYTTAKFNPKNANSFTEFDLNSGNYHLGVSLESIVPYGMIPLGIESVIFHNEEPFSNIGSLTSFGGLTLDYQLSILINGVRVEWHSLKLHGVTIFANNLTRFSSRYHQHREGFRPTFYGPRLYSA
jgi:hypothetical protein